MSIEIIIALLALIGTLSTGVFQLSVYKSQAKKSSVEAEDILMNRALMMSKQEVETLRIINDDLRAELVAREKEIDELQNKVQELGRRLMKCEGKLSNDKENRS